MVWPLRSSQKQQTDRKSEINPSAQCEWDLILNVKTLLQATRDARLRLLTSRTSSAILGYIAPSPTAANSLPSDIYQAFVSNIQQGAPVAAWYGATRSRVASFCRPFSVFATGYGTHVYGTCLHSRSWFEPRAGLLAFCFSSLFSFLQPC